MAPTREHLRTLQPTSIGLWALLDRLAGQKPHRGKLSGLAAELGVSEKTVTRATKELVAHRIIETRFGQGQIKEWRVIEKYSPAF